jgi:toxin ParE1/3/4
MRAIVSPRAQADIDDIWDYTVECWGERQAALYLKLIKATVDAVAKDPGVGRNCDDVRPGVRRYQVGAHVVFYRVFGTAIVVVRVLHQRMDVERHL